MGSRENRIVFEVVLLIAVLVALVQVGFARFIFDERALAWLLVALVLVLAGVAVYRHQHRAATLARDTGLLRGALWDLVRLMENNGTRGAGRRAGGRTKLLERFAVDGAAKVGAGREMPMGGSGALDLTQLAFELMDRNDKDGSGHWRRVNGIRRGCYAFLVMTELGALDQAYRAIIDHMIRQRDRADGLDNFPEFKTLLGLPVGIPQSDWTWLEGAAQAGLPLERARGLRAALDAGLEHAFAGLWYKPWPDPDEEEATYRGREILAQMREYIR